ncbi:MAG: glycoside hydrolase family 32 protein [Bacteroidota bacterium]|nr:glycoside hydrolase family 32 protein [Bacteroidota bacterium]
MNAIRCAVTIFFVSVTGYLNAQNRAAEKYDEPHRPQVHFSPKAHWMNDPNGMVYYNGIYHLFFQYYPGGTVWGPMHWGHAESRDMVHWKELPAALYPDSLGYIFSGSAVVDSNNTSGFGRAAKIPLVAIFTHHDPKGEKAGKDNFQNQSLAYSLDNGATWVKYSGNPVLKNPGIRDFRDPKVMWYAKQKKWVMTLATLDRISFYSSPDLKRWRKESEFGRDMGAHGGVWECPDLFPLSLNGKTYWILIVNLNPGGPNKGSATQYFVGRFDGNKFTALDTQTRWLDYGPDEYAGVIWGNTGTRKVFLGWMSNWLYANKVPTEKWRNAMTVPRQLSLKQVNGNILLASLPVAEFKKIEKKTLTVPARLIRGKSEEIVFNDTPPQYLLNFNTSDPANYTITLSNQAGERLVIGFNKTDRKYYIDRSRSGIINFSPDFGKLFSAPRLTAAHSSDLKLIVDASSAELFADGGLTVMTSVFFPHKPFDHLTLTAEAETIKNLRLAPLSSVWQVNKY